MSTPESKGASPGPRREHSQACFDILTRRCVCGLDGDDGKPLTKCCVCCNCECGSPEMAAMLRKLEWRWCRERCEDRCDVCDMPKTQGHSPDCPLDALLTKVGR